MSCSVVFCVLVIWLMMSSSVSGFGSGISLPILANSLKLIPARCVRGMLPSSSSMSCVTVAVLSVVLKPACMKQLLIVLVVWVMESAVEI